MILQLTSERFTILCERNIRMHQGNINSPLVIAAFKLIILSSLKFINVMELFRGVAK